MKIEFKQDNFFKQMDSLIIDGERQITNIPRWLFEMLPEKKRDIAETCLREMFKAGFSEGQRRKSKEFQELLNKLRNI